MRRCLSEMFEHAYDCHIIRPDIQVPTADDTGVDDLHSSVPTTGLRMSKRIPLPRNRVALHEGYGETDNG